VKHPLKGLTTAEDLAREARSRIGLRLSSPQARLLVSFEALLRARAIPMGLIAPGDAPRLRERHLVDCLRAARVVSAEDATAYDLGSGAGLPGVVVAIARPSVSVVLVEARRRRVAFLEVVLEELALPNATVASSRAEDMPGPVDLCFARALSSLDRSWRVARPLLRPGGRLVYFAGEGARSPERLPGARSVSVVGPPLLERTGPLVIMARQ
jgi:16S rRNA (guanine527-N7)-methyltransferase